MSVKVKEWIQRDWTRAHAQHFHDRGDFWNMSGLMPSTDRPGLKRAPALSAFIAFPSSFHTCRGIFYDPTNDRVVFVGLNGSNQLATCYAPISTWTMAGPNTIQTGLSDLGGYRGRDFLWWGQRLYVIGNNYTLYRTAFGTYSGTASSFHNPPANYAILAVQGDRVYASDVNSNVYRLNLTNTAMESHFNEAVAPAVQFLTPYRTQLYGYARDAGGRSFVVKLNPSPFASNPELETEAEIPDTGGGLDTSLPYAQFQNELFFVPGVHTSPDGETDIPLYSYRYSTAGEVDHITTVHIADSDPIVYLVPHRAQLLMGLFLQDDANSAHIFKLAFPGGGVADCIPATGDAYNSIEIVAASCYGHLVFTGDDNSDEGIYHLGPDTGFQDGYVQSSYLDMGHPGRQKRLNRISVLLDGYATDFKVIIKYRTDDTAGWTTLVTGNGEGRVSADITTPTTFYQLQLRIDLDDDTGNDEYIRIEAISVTYTVDE